MLTKQATRGRLRVPSTSADERMQDGWRFTLTAFCAVDVDNNSDRGLSYGRVVREMAVNPGGRYQAYLRSSRPPPSQDRG